MAFFILKDVEVNTHDFHSPTHYLTFYESLKYFALYPLLTNDGTELMRFLLHLQSLLLTFFLTFFLYMWFRKDNDKKAGLNLSERTNIGSAFKCITKIVGLKSIITRDLFFIPAFMLSLAYLNCEREDAH